VVGSAEWLQGAMRARIGRAGVVLVQCAVRLVGFYWSALWCPKTVIARINVYEMQEA
jgi:hypothetical protein